MIERLPNCIDIEMGLLSGILLSEGEALKEIGHRLEPEDFYATRHQVIYHTLKEMWLAKQPIDLATLKHELENNGRLEKVGGRDFLLELEESIPAIHNASGYATIIRRHSAKRKAIKTSSKLLQGLQGKDGNIAQMLEELEKQVNEIESGDTEGATRIVDALSMVYSRLQDIRNGKQAGISTGYKDLDSFIYGFRPGGYYVLAGRPSMGKSALAWNFIRHVAINQSVPTLVFSLEVGIEECATNLLIQQGKLDGWKLRHARLKDDDWGKVAQTMDSLSEVALYFNEATDISGIYSQGKSITQQKDIGFIVVDYVGLIASKGGTREQEVALVSRTLKRMAVELNVPILAVSQLNRGVEARENKRPLMSDLRESGSIEQDADAVLLLYREDYYKVNSPKQGTVELIVGKHRNGPTGVVGLTFIKNHMRFESLAREGGSLGEV